MLVFQFFKTNVFFFLMISQLFGAEDPDEAVSPDGEDPENMGN